MTRALENQFGHPGDLWKSLEERVADQGVTSFGEVSGRPREWWLSGWSAGWRIVESTMSRPNRFRVMKPYADRRQFGPHYAPDSIPWEMVEPHRERALINHGRHQDLERLNERGGLSVYELHCLFTDSGLFPLPEHIDVSGLGDWLWSALEEHEGVDDDE